MVVDANAVEGSYMVKVEKCGEVQTTRQLHGVYIVFPDTPIFFLIFRALAFRASLTVLIHDMPLGRAVGSHIKYSQSG